MATNSFPLAKVVLVPVDQSERARRAFDYAVRLAKTIASEIIILSVLEDIPASPGSYISIGELENTIKEDLGRYVSELANSADSNGVKSKALIRKGHPVKVILDVARSENADLIVMGSRGLGEFKEMLLGSVSHGVIGHSTVPVLIVK